MRDWWGRDFSLAPWSAIEKPRICNQRGVSKVQATKLISSNMVAGGLRQSCSIQRQMHPQMKKYTFEWSNPNDLMHNFVGRHWFGCKCVCVCVCYLYLFRSLYLATLSSLQFPAVSWQKKSKDCNNLYIQQFTASLSTEFKMRTGGDVWNLKSTKKCGTKNVKNLAARNMDQPLGQSHIIFQSWKIQPLEFSEVRSTACRTCLESFVRVRKITELPSLRTTGCDHGAVHQHVYLRKREVPYRQNKWHSYQKIGQG